MSGQDGCPRTESFLRELCNFLSSVAAVAWTTFFLRRGVPLPPMRTAFCIFFSFSSFICNTQSTHRQCPAVIVRRQNSPRPLVFVQAARARLTRSETGRGSGIGTPNVLNAATRGGSDRQRVAGGERRGAAGKNQRARFESLNFLEGLVRIFCSECLVFLFRTSSIFYTIFIDVFLHMKLMYTEISKQMKTYNSSVQKSPRLLKIDLPPPVPLL